MVYGTIVQFMKIRGPSMVYIYEYIICDVVYLVLGIRYMVYENFQQQRVII